MRKSTRGLYGAFFFLVFSQPTLSAEVKAPLPVITEGQLANGLHYTLVPLHSDKGRIDVRLQVDAGSLDETRQQSGVAHMVEHMVFRGTEVWPAGVANALSGQGWKRGLNYNAVTNYERTQFMMSPPDGAKGLGLTLKALAQMTAHAQMTQADLDDERKVILEEWRGKLGVAGRMNEQRIGALRDGSLYPQRPTIGTKESIEQTPASTLADFYHHWYQPGNMRLMVIGDIEPQQVHQLIARYFSGIPDVPLTIRSNGYYNQQLKAQLRVVRLQDSESGVSQVSWVNRFDDAQSAGTAGYRERLINQIALNALTRQLKRQRNELPDAVDNVVARKSDTGRSTVAFGLFTNAMPGDFDQALETLIRERERLLRFGLSSNDIKSVKDGLTDSAQRLKAASESRTFSEWVQLMNVAWQKKESYVGTQERAARALAELATISVPEVNARLKQWLQAPDNLVQFSVPGRTVWKMPLPADIQQKVARIAASALRPTPEETAADRALPPLPQHNTTGSIVSTKSYPAEQVQEWQLSNGDRVVVMKTPLANGRVWLQARSDAGYLGRGLIAWQAQLAAQLAVNGAPAGWREEDYQRWLTDRGVKINISQAADRLEVSGSAANEHLDALLGAYQLLHSDNHLDAASVKSSLMTLARRRVMQEGSRSAQRERDVTELRYGKAAFSMPDAAQLSAAGAEQLEVQWRKIIGAPVSWFVMTDLPDARVKKSVEHYLAGIPRTAALPAQPRQAIRGQHQRISQLNIEPKADVTLWSFSEESWSPEAAVQVSIARNLVSQYLKQVLRDDARGIYNLRFNSELNDSNQRIETELRFSTSPERAKELTVLARQALKDAVKQITASAVDAQIIPFRRAESSRRHEFFTQQRRLMLSYRHFNNPGYLSRVGSLDKAITTDSVRAMAARLYNPDNQVIYTVLPQEKK